MPARTISKDQFEQYRRLCLLLADVREIVKDKEIEAIQPRLQMDRALHGRADAPVVSVTAPFVFNCPGAAGRRPETERDVLVPAAMSISADSNPQRI
ncbi:hypothetical protein [Paraburkholderia sp. BR10954]|uniref:hypothetical protein n=1 Tax=Paraburkholderia sp. BR10954 TaxID=3236995 RepID=UPI0034D16058